MKLDLRKELPGLYQPKRGTPAIVEVPSLDFLTIDGSGPPASGAYGDAIATLYPVVYTLKFSAKERDPDRDFAVMPLESLWWTEGSPVLDVEEPTAWRWRAMIAVPPWVRASDVAEAARTAVGKRPLSAIDALRLTRFREGRCVQVLHLGPYANEGPTIEAIRRFIEEHGLEAAGKHHEIYLSDPRRTAPERIRTIVRQPVRRATRRAGANGAVRLRSAG